MPCDSRNDSKVAKLLVWKASPNTDAGVLAPAAIRLESEPAAAVAVSVSGAIGLELAGLILSVEPGSSAPSAPRAVDDNRLPSVRKLVPGFMSPPARRLFGPVLNAAQLMPVENWSFRVTSMIFASSMTWRSTTSDIAFR